MATPSLEAYCFSITLQKGDRGATVEALCRLLVMSNRGLNLSGLKISDMFTRAVKQAVKTFQTQTFIDPTGIVTPLTWQALCANTPLHMPTIRLGNHGVASHKAQECLKALGFYKGPVDGYFGPETHFSMIDFQSTFGLVGDGIVDSITWDRLGRATSRVIMNA